MALLAKEMPHGHMEHALCPCKISVDTDECLAAGSLQPQPQNGEEWQQTSTNKRRSVEGVAEA